MGKGHVDDESIIDVRRYTYMNAKKLTPNPWEKIPRKSLEVDIELLHIPNTGLISRGRAGLAQADAERCRRTAEIYEQASRLYAQAEELREQADALYAEAKMLERKDSTSLIFDISKIF